MTCRTRIGIVGGGLMGLALARRLTEYGCAVDVLERDTQFGGLATYHDFGGVTWDRFYHVILPSDTHLIRFIHNIGLGDALKWQRTRTGFFVDGKMHSISNSLEFLKFPLLSPVDKLRLAWTMIYGSRIDDWQRLETMYVEDWLVRVSGQRTYEKMWRPLLLAKLGECYKRVSAVFIWSYIKRLFSARDTSAGKEQLGYVSGGYKMIIDRIEQIVADSGGNLRSGVQVTGISPAPKSGINISLGSNSEVLRYDKVICTSPVPVLQKLVDNSLIKVSGESANVEYLGVVCVTLITTTPVVPFYVVNIADETIPFTGIIGMSSVVAPQYTDGKYLTYLPKYVLSTDEWLSRSDDAIANQFVKGLVKILPNFEPASIESVHVNRAVRVQPLQVINYSKGVPTVETRHKDFFVLNTAQFVNATLNNNEVIGAVDRFVSNHGHEMLTVGEQQ